ncbi:hypothetical protein Q4520_13225 [Alteromonas sp. 1_MG-2023]|uniref:hypothetical protein n=1 Tax=Alteromonas sp. 1_MG-2023 TaxID=3062669 RepID=UPI0026E489FA|nr:hypothetical protein [Alteromonas sp. 1_MG-2023]MDO6476391.1 hypothetical protein [Alteromonas sp. 1_MG-2023]
MRKNKFKFKNLKLYSNKSIQISAVLFANIFSAKSKSLSSDFIKVNVSRTKYESIEYTGYELDCMYDFQLFSLIIRKAISENFKNDDNFKNVITLGKNEIFDYLNIDSNARRASRFKSLSERVKKISCSKIAITRNTIKGDELFIASFINNCYLNNFDGELLLIVELNECFFNLFDVLNSQYIDMNLFNDLKSQYSRSLYLYLTTKRFNTDPSMYINVKRDELAYRITHSKNLEEKKRNQIVRESLKELISKEVIWDFNFKNGAEMITIKIKNQKQSGNIKKKLREEQEMIEAYSQYHRDICKNVQYRNDDVIDLYDDLDFLKG